MIVIEFLKGLVIGVFCEILLKTSKKLYAIFSLILFGILGILLWLSPPDLLLHVEILFVSYDFIGFILGVFFGIVTGDHLYEVLT